MPIESRPTAAGKPAFRVRIRLAGYPSISKSFKRRTDAVRWQRKTEGDIQSGQYDKTAAAKKHSLAELIDKYVKEILPTKLRNARS